LSDHESALGLRRNALGEYGVSPIDGVLARHAPDPRSAAPDSRPADVEAPVAAGPTVAPSPTRPRSPARPDFASWGRRTSVGLVDVTLFALVAVPASLALGGLSFVASDHRTTLRFGTSAFVVTAALGLLYFGVLPGWTTRTAGKVLLGTRLVDESSGAPIGPGRGVLRVLVCLLLAALCLAPLLVDLLWPWRDGRRQTLHDKAVGSVVVDTSSTRGSHRSTRKRRAGRARWRRPRSRRRHDPLADVDEAAGGH
jgi:uncharacterized RDD family membrane protein YckC